MQIRFAIFALALWPALAGAQNDPRQAQLQAATANGTASLREQVLQTRVNHDLLVSDYLQSTKSLDELNRIIQSAQPVGGARWVDDHTCQIRMELPASAVEAFLLGIAHDDSRHSPIRPDALKAKLAAWNHEKFSVVGSSAGGDAIESARPHEGAGNWSEVTDSARRSAVAAARADAVQQVMDGLGAIVLTEKLHGSDVLKQPAIADRMNHFLLQQPVTRIVFQDDLKVSVTLSITPKSLANAFQSAVQSQANFKSIDWPHADQQMQQLPESITGTASTTIGAVATSLPVATIPSQPPDWVDQKLEAEATAAENGSRLKTGRTAEASAVEKIHQQFLLLHITPSCTLGDAAGSDPQIKQAIDRALLHARTGRVDYHKDGSVQVHISLDLQAAWDELRSNP